jgi:phosphonate transport system ATP-binding protein
MPPPVIILRRAGRRFASHDAVADIDLTVRAGERVAVLGASGAGKSTLVSLLNGSLPATSGEVEGAAFERWLRWLGRAPMPQP